MTVLEQFATAGFPYDFNRGPLQVRGEQDALQGLNCIALGHLALERLYGVTLPPDLHCDEMYRDMGGGQTHLRPLAGGLDVVQEGDLIWLGLDQPATAFDAFRPQHDKNGFLTNWRQSPLRHLVVATGNCNPKTGDLQVLHTSPVNNTEIAPLSVIMEHKAHQKVWGVGALTVARKVGIAA